MTDVLSDHDWPHPILTRIHEPGQKPTRDRVLQNIKETHANAASITTSTLGAHGFGLLGITTNAAEYLAATTTNWVDPVMPEIPVAGGTQFEIAERQRIYAEATNQWRLCKQAGTRIRNQQLASADDIYWKALEQPLIGYGQRTARELNAHLMRRYAKFTEEVRVETETAMSAPWTGGPFESAINQINMGAATYAQADIILTAQHKCDKLYLIAKGSGQLNCACKKWRQRATEEKTWANCQTHFQDDADDLENDATASSAGYNTANHVQEQAMIEVTEALRDITNQRDIQQAHFASDKQTADQRITKLEADLKASQTQLKSLTATLTAINMNSGYGGGNRNRGTSSGRKDFGSNDFRLKKCYCHTCGYNDDHDSPNCRVPGEHHKKEATRKNPMDGKGHRKRR